MSRPSKPTPFAKRSLGQNFLTDPNYIKKIIDAVDPEPGDAIIEIGPGRGALTEKLVESGANIIAVELDRDLARVLSEKFAKNSNFQVVEQDILVTSFATLATLPPADKGSSYKKLVATASDSDTKVVANLPYNISTAILQRLTEQRHLLSELVLMFQREVVERITAKHGSSERGFLTVIVEACFDVEKLFDVPPTAFRPVPKVWSSVVRLIPKLKPDLDEAVFRNVVSSAFAHKRKTILNNLKASWDDAEECLNASGIETRRRAESLSLDEWVRLSESLSAANLQKNS